MSEEWIERVAGESGPKYLRIARAIEGAVRDGTLSAGDQLPPQRELAEALEVTVGTVARAYQEAQEQGWVGGHVGRGTFVTGSASPATMHRSGTRADLTLNQPIDLPVREALRAEFRSLAQEREAVDHLLYRRAEGVDHSRAAAAWLGRSGREIDPDETLVTAGGQHGLLLSLLATCDPGDVVLTEGHTHPGLIAVAERLRLRLAGLRADSEGIDPEQLRRAVDDTGARTACFTPVLQNPTGITWSDRRFDEIAAVASDLGLTVIEDDVYRNLRAKAPASLHSRLEGTVLVSSISKALTAGLRVGAVAAGEPLLSRMRGGVAESMVMVSPLTVELASRLILGGELDRHLAEHRERIEERHRIAREHIPTDWILSPAEGLHLWMRVPRRWTPGALLDALRREGVLVTPGDAFAAEPVDGNPMIRVSVGGQLPVEAFESAVQTLVGVANAPSQAPGPIV